MSAHRGDTHPFIASLIHARDQLHKTLFIDEQYVSALKQMVGVLSTLKPEDLDGAGKELRSRTLKEWATITTMQSINGRERRAKENAALYLAWYQELNGLLWDKRYFENRKYDPSGLEELNEDEGWVEA